MTETRARTSYPTRRVPWRTDLASVGAAMACALVTWLCVAELGGVDLAVRSGGETRHVGGLAVALTAAVAALGGLGLLRLLERRTVRAVRTWSVVVVVVAVVSLLGPLGAQTWSARGALAALHGVVAAVVLSAGRSSRR